MLKRFVLTSLFFALVLITVLPFVLSAQAQKETVAKPQSAKDKASKEKKLKKELESPYKKWLDEEVRWIISDEERTAFNRLETDEQRQSFIESFWLRRDPTPDTDENEFREEHYRRVAWANDRYASGIPGWKTDRGQIYIKLGAPDETDEHPTGGPGIRPIEEGGGETTFFPYETWRYRYIEGVGSDIKIEFVDKSMTNEYRLTWNPSEKDALLNVPGAGLTLYEQMGLADKSDRFQNVMNLGKGPLSDTSQMNMFDRLNQYVNLQKAPPAKFKDLEAAINSTIKYNLLPMLVRTDYIPVTESSVLTYITIQFDRADLQFRQKEGAAEAVVNLQARLTTMTGKRVGTLMEDTVKVGPYPAEQLGQFIAGKSLYSSKQALLPGRYKLSVVAKDVVGGNMSTYDVAIDVPRFQEDELSASSLILADVLEKVPTNSIGKEQFVIGSTKVRPKLDETFKKTDTMGIYMQMYNFQQNPETRKPEGTVEFEIIRNGSNETVVKTQPEDVADLTGGSSQMILEKKLKLDNVGLAPGDYTLKIKVTDSRRNETVTPTAHFKVI